MSNKTELLHKSKKDQRMRELTFSRSIPRTLFTAAHTTTQAPEAESLSIIVPGSSSGYTRNIGPGPPVSIIVQVYIVRPLGSTILA